MAKRIRGTIGASGNITITFASVDYIVSVVRATDGTYDAALPIALSNLMFAGGTAAVSYAGQTVTATIPVSGGGGTVVTGGLGVVGQSPPTYSGVATLPAIPLNTGGGTGLTATHYGSGQVEFQWKAAAAFNEGAGDKYQLVIDNVVRYVGVAHSHLRNAMSSQAHTASIRIVRASGEFGPATSINFNVSY